MVSRNTQIILKKYGRAFRVFITLSVFFVIYFSICVFAVKPVYADFTVIQSLAFRGNMVFSWQQLKKIVKSREGMEFDQKQFEKDLSAIVSHYHKEGYTFARIKNPARNTRFFPDGVYLMIEIDEGIIGDISVSGNEHTKEEVIVRELLFEEGAIYNREDELESERILRRKQSLGKAEIIANRNSETGKVDIEVEVTDLWTLFPSLSLPIFDGKDSNISIAISDSNIFGYGQKAKLRYEHTTDSGSETSISGSFIEPRLFDSHFLLYCDFAKKMGEIPWKVRLVRPFYSLKTNWGMEFMAAEQIDTLEWLSPQNDKVIEELPCNQRIKFGRITRSLGRRKSQIRLSLWGILQEKEIDPPPVFGGYEDGTTNMIGLSFSRAKVDFIEETFLNKLGRIEDIQLGYNYGISMGYALAPDFSLVAGSSENEIKLMLHGIYSQKYGKRNFFDVRAHLQTQRILGHQRDTIAVMNARYFLKDFLTSQRHALLRQTLAVRLSGRLGDNLETQQLILDAKDGLRGYGDDRFVGTEIFFLNIEDRMVFFKHPVVVIGGVVFADMGCIPRRHITKRSAGIGLRVGIPKLSGSPVYRLDLAYAFDDSRKFSWTRAFSFTMEHLF